MLIHQNPAGVEFFESFNDEFEAANPGVTIDLSIVEADALSTTNQTRLTAEDIDVTTISLSGFDKAVQDVHGRCRSAALAAADRCRADQGPHRRGVPRQLRRGRHREFVVQRRRLRGRARPHDLQRDVRERRPARRGRRRDADDVRRTRRGLRHHRGSRQEVHDRRRSGRLAGPRRHLRYSRRAVSRPGGPGRGPLDR